MYNVKQLAFVLKSGKIQNYLTAVSNLLTLTIANNLLIKINYSFLLQVKALKEKVEKEKGSDYPAVGQKLIYAGELLMT